MGQKDISLVRYFEDSGRYADLINGFLFGGEQIVSRQDVQEMDSRVTGVWGEVKAAIYGSEIPGQRAKDYL